VNGDLHSITFLFDDSDDNYKLKETNASRIKHLPSYVANLNESAPSCNLCGAASKEFLSCSTRNHIS